MLNKDFLKWHLESNRAIRTILKPWKDKKLKKSYNEYLQSGYAEKLKQFRDTHRGDRCFIIGNGPSLKAKDLDLLKNEYTFAANRIYEIFSETIWRPWTYVVVDKDFMKEQYKMILKVPCEYRFLRYDVIPNKDMPDNAQIFYADRKFSINKSETKDVYVSEDITKGISDGRTVTFISIQLAIYMGFEQIFLLGVDFSYKNMVKDGRLEEKETVQTYFNGKEYSNAIQDYNVTLYAYQKAKEYADSHGIKIYNATRGGKLEIFERVDFDELMKKEKEQKGGLLQ